MTIQVTSHSIVPPTSEKVVEQKEESASAPEVKATEQKEPSESETEETEAKNSDESKDESESNEDAEESNDSDKDKPKKKGGFQRRIDKLNARNTAAQQELEYWKSMAIKSKDAVEPKKEPVETQKFVAVAGKPEPESFDSHSEYVEALTDWKLEQRDKLENEKANKSRLQVEQEKALKDHYDREASFAEKTKDYKEVIDELMESNPKTSVAFEELILSSDHGPELLYLLAKDMNEFDRINSLSPLAAAREFGKLEAKIASNTSEDKKPEIKKITKAPQPIVPVGSKGGVVTKSLDDPNLSQVEYEKLRREQMRSA